jgi:hypothetical protein
MVSEFLFANIPAQGIPTLRANDLEREATSKRWQDEL